MKVLLIYIIPNIISLATVIILYKKLHPVWLRLFLFFLLFTFLEESGAYTYSYYLKKSNHYIANIYSLISFNFYFLLFYINAETIKFKKTITVLVALYILFALTDMFLINGFFYFNTYSFAFGSILIILTCLLYFTRLFISENVMNYFRLPMFWIATGLLFSFTGNLVQNSLIRYFIANNIDPGGRIYYFIIVTLNIVLHSFFIISFLCNTVWKKAR